jgi:hypothetical protein
VFVTYNTVLLLQDIALHHIIRTSGKYASQIKSMEQIFRNSNFHPRRNSAIQKLLKNYRKLLFTASLEELANYDAVLCTCAVGCNTLIEKALSGLVYQV